ncbi:MAG: type II toxin-antitoxin system HicB family antitoxin [Nitrospinae bacterium]|nr:type II toxin-antitoxin system HicB family antitoxin [Nitrospinota bacterium]
MKRYYKVILEPQEEGGFTALVPSLPGCISQGDTYDEAIANIKEAMDLYIESLEADGLPVPEENRLFLEVEASV